MIHALLVAVLVSAAPAKPAAPAAPADAAAQAKEAFAAGQKLYKAGKFAEAIARFEEAYRAKPHPVIYFNIGKCWEQLSENAKALRAYRDYLRLAPDAKDRDTVTDAIANLERRLREKGLQQLLVFAEPATARIVVDGKDIGASPASVELVAGSHTLVVTADGFTKVDRTFNFTLNRSTEMTVALEPEKAKPTQPVAAADAPKKDEPKKDEGASKVEPSKDPGPPPPPPLVANDAPKKVRVFTWVAAGAAVAAAGTGVALGLVAQGKADAFNKNPPTDPVEAQAQFAQVKQETGSLAMGANISYAVAGAAAVTAVVLFFLEK